MVSKEAATERSQIAIKGGSSEPMPDVASLAQFDQQSASRMLRRLLVFAWALAGAVVASALFGLGSPLSNALALLWFVICTWHCCS